MAASDSFRSQHREMLDLVNQMSSQLGAAGAQAESIRKGLSKLAGKLLLHLAMEDKSLYPKLKVAPDPKVRETAARFTAEMGGLAATFTAYNAKWTAALVTAQPDAFVRETRAVFSALAKRIDGEERGLYPLLDALAA